MPFDVQVIEAKKRAAALMGGNGASAPAAAAAPAVAAPAAAPVGRADGRIIATPYAKQLAKELKVRTTCAHSRFVLRR